MIGRPSQQRTRKLGINRVEGVANEEPDSGAQNKLKFLSVDAVNKEQKPISVILHLVVQFFKQQNEWTLDSNNLAYQINFKMEVLHPKFMFFLIFVMDVIYNISKEAIAISAVSNKSTAIATVAVFGALSSFTLFTSLVVLIASEKTFISCCTWLLQVVIVEIYFYGTNMNIIIERFGKELGCVEKCAIHNQIAAIGCLGCTLLLLYSIPLLHDYIKKSSSFKQHSLWHYFYGVILVLVHINTVYAAVLSTIPESLKCFREILGLSIVFLVVAIVIGGMSIFSNNDIWNKDKIWTSHSSIGDKRSNYILKGAVLLLIAILPLYLISNNQLPLHYINCSSAGNSTAADCYDGGPDHVITEHIIKLVGMVVTGVIVLLVMVVFKYQKRAEKLKEEALHLLSGEVNL